MKNITKRFKIKATSNIVKKDLDYYLYETSTKELFSKFFEFLLPEDLKDENNK